MGFSSPLLSYHTILSYHFYLWKKQTASVGSAVMRKMSAERGDWLVTITIFLLLICRMTVSKRWSGILELELNGETNKRNIYCGVLIPYLSFFPSSSLFLFDFSCSTCLFEFEFEYEDKDIVYSLIVRYE